MLKQLLNEKTKVAQLSTNVVPNNHYTETTWPTWACAYMHEIADCYANHSIMDLDAWENQHLFVVN